MKAFVNLAWLIDLGLVGLFIVLPTYNLVIADNCLTDPTEIKAAVIMITVGLLVLSPITWALNGARKLVNRKR